jgi:chromosome segregation ATPase
MSALPRTVGRFRRRIHELERELAHCRSERQKDVGALELEMRAKDEVIEKLARERNEVRDECDAAVTKLADANAELQRRVGDIERLRESSESALAKLAEASAELREHDCEIERLKGFARDLFDIALGERRPHEVKLALVARGKNE